MDQPNPTNPNAPAPDPNDLSINVMPQDGKVFSGYSSAPAPSMGSPPSATNIEYSSGGSSHKWVYIIIGIIVLLALGGAAYYMLGTKKEDVADTGTSSKLPKVWMTQYFNAETCSDQNTCGDNADPESDGLKNYDEFKAGTNPLNPDTDSDGLADGDEVNIYKTEPMLKYTDRREVVAQGNLTDGLQIKNGYDPLTPGLKFTETRKLQIAGDTTTFKLHEPSISTTTSASTPPPSSSTEWKNYSNAKYGFGLTLTDAWKGYQVYSSEGSQGVGHPTYLQFSMPTTDKTKCVQSVTDQVCGYIQIFEITIWDKSIWDEKTADQKKSSQVVGQNATSVYIYDVRPVVMPTDLTKINFEVPKVIATFKLTK